MSKEEGESLFEQGFEYYDKDEFKKAIQIWKKIKREDDLKIYTAAQLYIGAAFSKLGKFKEAIDVREAINKNDNAEVFEKAQFNLQIVSYLDEVEKESEKSKTINNVENPEISVKAKLIAIEQLMLKKDIDNMIKMWNEIEISETYELVIDESIKVMVNFFSRIEQSKRDV